MGAPAAAAVERRHPPDAAMRVVNPVMRTLLRSPLHRPISGSLLLLHYTGRRTGRSITLPVGYHDIGGARSLLTNSRWRHNFRGGRDAEITLQGERRPVHAVLVDDVAAVTDAYEEIIGRLGWEAAQRRLGIRINVGRAPTRAELEDAVRTSGLSIVRLDPR